MVCRYVKSRSDTQVRSKGSEGATDTCQPEAVTSNGQPVVHMALLLGVCSMKAAGFQSRTRFLMLAKRTSLGKVTRRINLVLMFILKISRVEA